MINTTNISQRTVVMELNKVIHGDCLDVLKDMEDNSIDLVLTDPPYGIGEANGKNKARDGYGLTKATDYGVDDWDDSRPSKKYFDELLRVSKKQIIFGGNYFADMLPPSSCWVVWDKDNGTTDFADCELAWTSFKTAVRIYKWRWNGMIQEPKHPKDTREHPTQKPTGLIKRILLDYSEEGQTILDPYLGSGTTAIACIKTNRNFIGIEKEQKYVDIANKRIQNELDQLKMQFNDT